MTHPTISITDTAALSWTVEGTQVITVTASNAYGTDVATHTIIIGPAHPVYLPLVMRNLQLE